MMTPIHVERFLEKVEVTEGCWIWKGSMDGSGYGQLRIDGRNKLAHRLAWVSTHGQIPDGFVIDHICHNRSCVNVMHLRLATLKQNSENRVMQRNNKSGFRGVSWNGKSGKWHANVRHNGRLISLGYFEDAAMAGAVVQAKRLELFTFNDADRSAR